MATKDEAKVQRSNAITAADPKDQVSFDEIFWLYQGRIFRFCLLQVGNRSWAEDLTSDTMAAAFAAYEKARNDGQARKARRDS